MSMEWEEIDFHFRRIREKRRAEAKAIEESHKKKGT